MNLAFLYLEFFKIGLFAVGGGFATLPFLFQMADKYEWLDLEMIGNFLAAAQSAPGAVGVNMAVQTGYQAGSAAGGLIAALGLVSPAIIIITITAGILKTFEGNKIAAAVFSGLRPAAAGLLAAAGFGVIKLALINTETPFLHDLLRVKECIIFAALFLMTGRLKYHPVFFIAAGAAAGIVLKL